MNILQLIKLTFLIVFCSAIYFGQTKYDETKNSQVLINVSVSGLGSKPVTELKEENFRVFENKKTVQITHFNKEDTPISVGFLLDVSRSMETNVDLSREAMLTFIGDSNPQNEYFITAMSTKVDDLCEFTNFADATKLISANPYFAEKKKHGETVLYDGIISAIEKFSKAKNQKRVLFIFWDAGDSYSSPKYKEVEKLVKEKNITVFLSGFRQGPFESSMEELAENSGGITMRPFDESVRSFNKYGFITRNELFLKRFAEIAQLIKTQYVIGFNPDSNSDKNKWRKLEVKVELPKEIKKQNEYLYVRHRKGYYPYSEIVSGN